MTLFSRELVFCSLGSGSSGNCTYIGDGHAGVLVDAGVGPRNLRDRLAEFGLHDAPIDAVLVTHEHGDHVGNAAALDRAFRKAGRDVPFYMTPGTRAGTEARSPKCLPEAWHEVAPGQVFRVKHLDIDPFRVPHDTGDPVAYRVTIGGTSVAVVTDLGKPTKAVIDQLRMCTIAALEFNHDEDMLMDGPYPWPLKQRVRGDRGHLSNRQGAELLSAGLSDNLQHLVLAHLSEHNNTERHARSAAGAVLDTAGMNGRIQLHVAVQRAAIAPIRVKSVSW